MDELSKHRAEKHNDARLWSPVDCIEDLLSEIKLGKVKPSQLVIYFVDEDGDGNKRYGYNASGMTVAEHLLLLEVVKFNLLRDYTEEV